MRNAIRYAGLPLAVAAFGTPAVGQGTPEGRDAIDLLRQSADVVTEMRADTLVAGLLDMAQGVYVIPEFGQGAAIEGDWGGTGVLLARAGDDSWGGPAFYQMAAVTTGVQVDFTAGPVVMLLMSDGAVDTFRTGGDFSLAADDGFSIIDISAGGQAITRGDVVIWSNEEGRYGGLAARAFDIDWDEAANAGYYGGSADPAAVIAGEAGRNPEAADGPDPLSAALAG